METSLTIEPTAEEVAELQTAIQRIFDQIDQVNVRIEGYQEDIDRLKAETRAMLAQLRAETGA
jgi:peptidoglycan hydrolase CwlO-like protein